MVTNLKTPIDKSSCSTRCLWFTEVINGLLVTLAITILARSKHERLPSDDSVVARRGLGVSCPLKFHQAFTVYTKNEGRPIANQIDIKFFNQQYLGLKFFTLFLTLYLK